MFILTFCGEALPIKRLGKQSFQLADIIFTGFSAFIFNLRRNFSTSDADDSGSPFVDLSIEILGEYGRPLNALKTLFSSDNGIGFYRLFSKYFCKKYNELIAIE